MATIHNGKIETSDRSTIVRAMNQIAQRRRGTNAAAIVKAYKSGKLEDPTELADLFALSRLLKRGDKLSVG
jgi:hypothetical protein